MALGLKMGGVMPSPDYASLVPQRPKIGTGRMIAGIIGDALAQLGGQRGLFASTLASQREEDGLLRRLLTQNGIERQNKLEDRQYDNDTWQNREQWKLDHTPKPLAVQLADEAGLTGNDRSAALRAAISGYGNTQPVIDARAAAAQNLAAFRASQSAALKAQPTYAQTHPKARSGSASKPAKLPSGFILD